MRNEQKFVGSEHVFRAGLFASGFKKHHDDRRVNSIYFDNSDLRDFWDGEEGSVPRTKTRVRFYGNLGMTVPCQLERKITYENSRDKWVIPLVGFDIQLFTKKIFQEFGDLVVPTIKVSYTRSYFVDAHGNRATLDRSLVYQGLNENGSGLMQIVDDTNILEIKTDLRIDENLVIAEVQNLKSRFSKYCTGVRLCMDINS